MLQSLPRVSLQFISSSGQCSIPSHQFSTGTQVWELGQILLPGSQCLQIQEQSRVSWERKPEEQGGQTLGLQCATPSFIQRHSSQLSFIIVTFLANLEKYISKDFESRMTEFITERKVVEPAKVGSTISHSHQDKLEPAKVGSTISHSHQDKLEPAKVGSTISHSHQDKLEPAKEK